MKTIVIYHRADFDGIFCREIAKKFLPHAELIGWDYGDPVPDPTVVSAEDDLYMLDISVEGLMGHPKLTWIDHHKSAIEKFTGELKHKSYCVDGVAACRLAWQWFMHEYADMAGVKNQIGYPLPEKDEYINRTVKEPLAVRLAGEYDIWDRRDPRAELFQHGLRSQELSEWDWKTLLEPPRKMNKSEADASEALQIPWPHEVDGYIAPPFVEHLLSQGKMVKYVQDKQNESIIKASGFTMDFEGLKFLACNHARYNSHLFTAGLTEEHDACLGFNFDGKQWRISLYHAPGKEHHDLSTIAVKHGGGGHRGACGFRMPTIGFIELAKA